MVVLLAGCGPDNSTSDSVESTVQIVGAAMKGVIQQGRVTANRLEPDGDGNYALEGRASRRVRTEDDGSYQWQLRGKAEGWVMAELDADQRTRMICDVVPQCDQPNAASVAFGQPMALDTDFILRGAGDLSSGTINLTPLTHLAVALAERSANGLSPDALGSAYATVEGWFGLAAGAIRMTPPDITRLDDMTGVSADAIQAAIANAALLAMVNDSAQWGSISEVLNNLTAQVRATGQISLLGDGSNVALADLVSLAALQAAELQATVTSGLISQQLALVQNRNVQHLETLAGAYTDSDTAVSDTEQPVVNETPTDTATVDTDSTDAIASAEPEPIAPPATESTTGTTVPANAALLSWTAPLTRENGDSLAMGEIAGFEVVYGTGLDNLGQSVAVGDASIDELLVDELTAGTWYFAIRTLDTDGNRSRLSKVVNKQI